MSTAAEMTAGLYFVFRVRDSRYALPAEAVRESLALPAISALEELPRHAVGVINLRGKVIPLLDLHLLFGRAPRSYRTEDAVVVVEAAGMTAGIIVDAVLDLVELEEGAIEPRPFSDPELSRWEYLVAGVAGAGAEIVMLLDPGRVLRPLEGWVPPECAGEELDTLDSAPADAGPADRELFRRRALQLAGRGDELESAPSEQVAVVALGGEYFALELPAVREFLTVGEVTPIPNCPEHVLGNMNVRGNILTLIDIRALLGLPPGRFSREAGIVVVADGEITAGIAVDEIVEIAPLDGEELFPLPSSVRGEVGKYARGTARHGERAMTVVSVAAILAEPGLIVQQLP